jgi:F0F1-type ATP synthase assembly protein I
MDASRPHRDQPHRLALTVAILLTLIETFVRVSLPSLVGAGAGLWWDMHHQTAPWFTLLGLVVGLAGAAVLVRQQLRRVR